MMILPLLAFAAQSAIASCAPIPLASALRAKDQALLDAIAPGNRALWEDALAPGAIYVDENGTVMTRADFLKALVPLPPGTSGHISIVDYQVCQEGDTALVIHKDDEREDYHGQALRAGYLMTETWLHRNGVWKLALVHAYVVTNDPPAVTLPESKLDEYTGRYRAGPDLVSVIRREGDHLVAGREGGTSHPLLVEISDVLFVPGQPRTRKIFQRDEAGHITGFLERREGVDVRWTRIP